MGATSDITAVRARQFQPVEQARLIARGRGDSHTSDDEHPMSRIPVLRAMDSHGDTPRAGLATSASSAYSLHTASTEVSSRPHSCQQDHFVVEHRRESAGARLCHQLFTSACAHSRGAVERRPARASSTRYARFSSSRRSCQAPSRMGRTSRRSAPSGVGQEIRGGVKGAAAIAPCPPACRDHRGGRAAPIRRRVRAARPASATRSSGAEAQPVGLEIAGPTATSASGSRVERR